MAQKKKTLADLPKDWQETLKRESQQGASHAELYSALGISKDFYHRLRHRSAFFEKEVQRAQDRAEAWWMKLGRGAAAGKMPGMNAAVWIFNMKNRFAWKDKKDLGVGDGEGGPAKIQIEVVGVDADNTEDTSANT